MSVMPLLVYQVLYSGAVEVGLHRFQFKVKVIFDYSMYNAQLTTTY